MSLALVQGYSSDEEEQPQQFIWSDSDDENPTRKEEAFPKHSTPLTEKQSAGSLLPSAFQAFSEVTGPPEFLNNSALEPIPTRPSQRKNAFGGWQGAKGSKAKKEHPAGVVMEAKAQLVGIRERVRSDVEGTVSQGSSKEMPPPKTIPASSPGDSRRTPGATMPPPEDAAKLLGMCLQCGVPKTYSNAREGVVCPVCGDRPIGDPNKEKQKGSTIKDREKNKRMKGQSSHATWKSETEMHLRQQFD